MPPSIREPSFIFTMEREKALKKIFAVSDIHGCADALKAALGEAGFDKDNPDHLLVVVGDLFDRGPSNREVLAFLMTIKNKILIRGNHEDILYEVLKSGRVGDLQIINGAVNTVAEFFPYYCGGGIVDMREGLHRQSRAMLTRLIDSMWDFFETDNYIFTHGWLTEDAGENDFRTAPAFKWHHARWSRWYNFYPYFPIPDGKALVVGHTPTVYARDFDATRGSGNFSIFRGENMIAIDGAAVDTGRLNVLVVDDYVTLPHTFTVELSHSEYQLLEQDGMRVWLTLFDGEGREYRRGDRITFVDRDRPAYHLTYKVNALRRYDSFDEAEDEYSPVELGYDLTYPRGFLASEMRKRYTPSEVMTHGALAVELTH